MFRWMSLDAPVWISALIVGIEKVTKIFIRQSEYVLVVCILKLQCGWNRNQAGKKLAQRKHGE